MRFRPCILSLPLWFVTVAAVHAEASDPQAIFDEAVRVELSGDGNAARAFALYRQAADAGLPAAQFNVAVMLDSGRGMQKDLQQAAVWYARAAARGDQRSAYNLGQLYEAGQGVPRNPDVARAWFAASNLPAARGRSVAAQAAGSRARPMISPDCVWPAADAQMRQSGDVELVWTSAQQPEPMRFFVELRALDEAGSREVFSTSTATTSVLVHLSEPRGKYMWRVLAVARQAGTYVFSAWSHFTVAGAG